MKARIFLLPFVLLGSWLLNVLLIWYIGYAPLSLTQQLLFVVQAIVVVYIIYTIVKFHLSIETVYVVIYTFFYVIGALLAYFTDISDISLQSCIYVYISFIFSLLGSLYLKSSVFKFKYSAYNYDIKRLTLLLDVAVLASISIGLAWFYRLGVIPIFAGDIEYARIELASGTYLNRQLMSIFIPIYYLYVYQTVSCHEGGSKIKIRQFGYLIIGIFLLVSQGFRTFPIVFVLISLLIYVDADKKKIAFVKVLSLSLICFLFVFLFGLMRFKSSSINYLDERSDFEVLINTFLVRPRALEDISAIFPNYIDFQNVLLYLRGLGFVPGVDLKGLGMWLKEDVFQINFAGAGYNPGILGEFYIAFGPNLLFVCMFMFGVLLGAVNKLKFSSITACNIAIRKVILVYLLLSVSPGLSTIMFDIIWYVSLLYVTDIILRTRRV